MQHYKYILGYVIIMLLLLLLLLLLLRYCYVILDIWIDLLWFLWDEE